MSKLGVIFTDTAVLADKYNCRRQEVIDIIGNYIHGCRNRGINWQLVDVGGHDFDYIFNEDVSWQGYCRALADNCAGMGWQTDCNTPLFIIGGDDVIPVPIIIFPEPGEQEMPRVQVDLRYCYPPDFNLRQEIDRFDEIGYNKGELYEYFMSKAVFNVSRLPLETGEMGTSLQQDLGTYFARCLASGGTINVDNVLPVTGFQWFVSTLSMIENLPLLPLGSNNGCHMSDIFVSPLLRMSDSAAMSEFTTALSKADMLMIKLHGSNVPEMTGFYGQGDVPIGTDNYGNPIFEQPQAFDIELLLGCNAKVFNTSACFGARYVEYLRSQSMLLSSIYNSQVLLYMGSSVSAWFVRPLLTPDVNVNNIKLVHLSDDWFKTYINLQMQGDSAGLAMLKSKWMFYDECGEQRDWASPLTIFEFNQFGDPTLIVRAPRYNRIHAQQPVKALFRHKTEKVLPHKEAYVSVYSKKTLPELDAAYADVRASVDAALLRLSDDLRRMLADDYHYPSHHLFLSSILREENSGGHLYVYAHEGRSDSERRVYVRVNAAGKVQKITYRM